MERYILENLYRMFNIGIDIGKGESQSAQAIKTMYSDTDKKYEEALREMFNYTYTIPKTKKCTIFSKNSAKEGVEGMRDKEKYIQIDRKDLLINTYTAYDITMKCPKCGLEYTEYNSDTEEMLYVECDKCGCKYKFIYHPF